MGWCVGLHTVCVCERELKPLVQTNTLVREPECLDMKARLRRVLLCCDGAANRRPVHVRLLNGKFTV